MKYGTFIEAEGDFGREIDFLSRARGPWESGDRGTDALGCIHVEASGKGLAGVATDRRRMHIVDPISISAPGGAALGPGAWRVLGVTGELAWIVKVAEEDAGPFVPWKKVIPEGKAGYTGEFAGYSPKWEKEGDTVGTAELTRLIRGFPEETAIQLRYLADLGTEDLWIVKWRGNRKAAVFESGNRKAVIMPLEPAGGTGKREEPWTGEK